MKLVRQSNAKLFCLRPLKDIQGSDSPSLITELVVEMHCIGSTGNSSADLTQVAQCIAVKARFHHIHATYNRKDRFTTST